MRRETDTGEECQRDRYRYAENARFEHKYIYIYMTSVLRECVVKENEVLEKRANRKRRNYRAY